MTLSVLRMGATIVRMGNRGSFEPGEVQDLQAFSELLRLLKARSGLSYRQLEERAAAVGDVLPRSSVSCMLNRELPPRHDLLIAFVRACGEGDRVAQWVEARDRVAAAHRSDPVTAVLATSVAPSEPNSQPNSRPVSGPNPEPTSEPAPERAIASRLRTWLRHPRRRLAAVVVAVSAAVLTVVAALQNSPEQQTKAGSSLGTNSPPGTGHAPPSGWVTIHIASDPKLCLSDGRVRDLRYTPLVAVQRPCESAAPQSTLLEPVGGGLYRLQWHHPDYGKGCLKALTSGSGAGLLEPMDDCADGSLLRVEPSGKLALGRFVLRVEGQGCVGIVRSSAAAGAEAVMQRCSGNGRQVFLIRAVDRDDGTGRPASSTVPRTRAAGK
jgi:hypothetical protein